MSIGYPIVRAQQLAIEDDKTDVTASFYQLISHSSSEIGLPVFSCFEDRSFNFDDSFIFNNLFIILKVGSFNSGK